MAHSSLRNHRKLKSLARRLKRNPIELVGMLQHLWWAVDECKIIQPNGHLDGWTATHIADSAEWDGDPDQFVNALILSGFLDTDGEAFAIHDYWQWCPDYVMKRWFEAGIIKDRARSTAFAASKCGFVTTSHDKSRLVTQAASDLTSDNTRIPNHTTPNVTKRNQTNSLPSAADAAPAEKVKPKPEKKPREPSPLWDTLAEAFFPSGVSKSDGSRLGKVVQALKAKSATPEQIRERIEAYPKVMPGGRDCLLTLEALEKHWDRLIPPKPGPSSDGITQAMFEEELKKWA